VSAGAAFYGNETIVGAGLSEFIAAGKRPELFITSKVWNTHHKPADSRWGQHRATSGKSIKKIHLHMLAVSARWLWFRNTRIA
jgi:alcohol dehydrogenase (NADP+)